MLACKVRIARGPGGEKRVAYGTGHTESIPDGVRLSSSAACPLVQDLVEVHERLEHYHSRIAAERRGAKEWKESRMKARARYEWAAGIWNEWNSERPNPYIGVRRGQTASLIQKCKTQVSRRTQCRFEEKDSFACTKIILQYHGTQAASR